MLIHSWMIDADSLLWVYHRDTVLWTSEKLEQKLLTSKFKRYTGHTR